MHTPTLIVAAFLIFLGGFASPTLSGQDASPNDDLSALIALVQQDSAAAVAQATAVRDQAIASWPTIELDELADSVERHAVVEMVASMPPSAQTLMVDVWPEHPTFMGALARVYTPANDAVSVATIAQAMAIDHAEALSQYPELAAAVCVVLDRPHRFPGLGAVRPAGAEVFSALAFADGDRRVTAVPLDAMPAELLVHLTDIALTGEGLRATVLNLRTSNPLELYERVRYQPPGLLAGEAAPTPEDFTFDRIVERGGAGPLRSFYAEQLGQAFGWPVSIATGHLGQERYQAPVFLESERRGYVWNLDAIAEHPGLALGTTSHPVSGEPMPLAELVVSADLARAGIDATRLAWALMLAARQAEAAAQIPMLEASVEQTRGFAQAWRELLALRLDAAAGDTDGPQRVLSEMLQRADQIAPVLGTQLALERITMMDDRKDELLEWMALMSRRDANRWAAARLAIGDAMLARGDRAGALETYQDVINRHAGESPLALDALARARSIIEQDGRDAEVFELHARTHRRLRAPRSSDAAQVLASPYMIVGEQYEQLLRDAGRDREADRLRRQLDRALP